MRPHLEMGTLAPQQLVEAAVTDLLVGLGEDVAREGLRDTPKVRLVSAFDSVSRESWRNVLALTRFFPWRSVSRKPSYSRSKGMNKLLPGLLAMPSSRRGCRTTVPARWRKRTAGGRGQVGRTRVLGWCSSGASTYFQRQRLIFGLYLGVVTSPTCPLGVGLWASQSVLGLQRCLRGVCRRQNAWRTILR